MTIMILIILRQMITNASLIHVKITERALIELVDLSVTVYSDSEALMERVKSL